VCNESHNRPLSKKRCIQKYPQKKVILLDEVDKLSHDTLSNPQGCLLEILDSEQNFAFKDHYINTPWDLSKTFFIATCNDLSTLDRPLRDRLEILELTGYTVEEKLFIGEKFLLPKQRKMHALESADGSAVKLVIQRKAMEDLIAKYTAESGVRGLERKIAEVCRWVAYKIVNGDSERRMKGYYLLFGGFIVGRGRRLGLGVVFSM